MLSLMSSVLLGTSDALTSSTARIQGSTPNFEARDEPRGDASTTLVVVVGSCNEDMICRGPRLPRPGETVEHSSFETCCGGKGANQAVQASLLLGSGKVELVGCVGTDAGGARQRAGLTHAGTGLRYMAETSEATSGVAVVTVAEQEAGANTIVVVPGANALLTSSHVDAAADELGRARIVLCQLEVPAAASLRAFELAQGIKTLNPAPLGGVAHEDLLKLVRAADLVCANELELAALVGRGDVDPRVLEAEPLEAAADSARRLAGDASVVVVATLGARGALVADAANAVHIPAWPLASDATTLDTSGAGDCFLGALAAFFASGKSLLAAARDAAKVASWSVVRPGTQPSYPSARNLMDNDPDPLLRAALMRLTSAPATSAEDPLESLVWPLASEPPTLVQLADTGVFSSHCNRIDFPCSQVLRFSPTNDHLNFARRVLRTVVARYLSYDIFPLESHSSSYCMRPVTPGTGSLSVFESAYLYFQTSLETTPLERSQSDIFRLIQGNKRQ